MSDTSRAEAARILAELQKWRDKDHQDAAVLSRSEVCFLLDEDARLRAALSMFACSCTACDRSAEDRDSACDARAALNPEPSHE